MAKPSAPPPPGYMDVNYTIEPYGDGEFVAVIRRLPEDVPIAYSKPWPSQQQAAACIMRMVSGVKQEAHKNGRDTEEWFP